MNLDDKRRAGIITSAQFQYSHDHKTWICIVEIDFDTLGHQAFGGFCMDTEDQGKDFVAEISATFGKPFNELAGTRCWGLWNRGENNETMAGVESQNGERFVIQTFRRKHWPETPSALGAAAESIQARIDQLTWQLADEHRKLTELEGNFMDWETEPLVQEARKRIAEDAL